jgi:hypothetical protein
MAELRSLTRECRFHKMKRPESHAPLMMGLTISHFRVIEMLGQRRADFVVNSGADIRLARGNAA